MLVTQNSIFNRVIQNEYGILDYMKVIQAIMM